MAEYIDREALLLRLKKVITTGDDFGLGMLMATSHAIECIEEAPAADVAEVKHGEWIDGRCTNCNQQADVAHVGFNCCGNGLIYHYTETNYCPSCGSKMDLKEGVKK